MNTTLTLRSFLAPRNGKWKTRRFHGRRSMTPMRHKGRKPGKTRYQPRVEKEATHDISIREHTGSSESSERKAESEKEHRPSEKREGDENGDLEGKWEDTEIHEEAVTLGNREDSTPSIHPGSLQELRELSASAQVTDETSPEEEEPPF